MLDMHCHVLPNIDDGANSVETSIEMLKIAEQDGITKIIATPHFHEGTYNNEFDDIVKQVNELNEISKLQNINIEILPSQEVFLDRNILKNFKSGKIKGINYTNYLLVELPMDRCPDYATDMIYELRLLGITTIIAHPERYRYIIDDISFINNFIDEECLFQINTTSILGGFGKSVKNTVMELLDHNTIDFIASDAHGTSYRTPQLKACYQKIFEINKALPNQLQQNLSNLINNETIHVQHDKIKPQKNLSKLIKHIAPKLGSHRD